MGARAKLGGLSFLAALTCMGLCWLWYAFLTPRDPRTNFPLNTVAPVFALASFFLLLASVELVGGEVEEV